MNCVNFRSINKDLARSSLTYREFRTDCTCSSGGGHSSVTECMVWGGLFLLVESVAFCSDDDDTLLNN